MGIYKKTAKNEQEMGLPMSKVLDPSEWLDRYDNGDKFTLVVAMNGDAILHMLKSDDGALFVYKEIRDD